MKIGIPTFGSNGLDENVCPHFGRAPTFTIIDMDKRELRTISNRSEHMGGIGKPPEQLANEGVEVMICSGLGPRAIQMFESYGIMVYVGAGVTVQETLDLYLNNKLTPATDENACKAHRH